MWIKETKAECCIDPQPLPRHIDSHSEDLCHELMRLYSKHRRAFVRNKRLMELAKPKHRVNRFISKCPCFLNKRLETVKLDQRWMTRTEQLAYPRVRRLLALKKEILNLFPPDRIFKLNRLIRKSLFSLYSRLANVQPPLEIKPIPKWDKAEWNKHRSILQKLAKPKVTPLPYILPRERKTLSELKRYKYLALPKRDLLREKPIWCLTLQMKNYKASERLNKLAKAIVRDMTLNLPDFGKHTGVHGSKRTLELAEPRRRGQAASADLKEDPFAITPNALKAKASKRTKELAEPKEYENKHIREDPYAISKAALTCTARPRIVKLAEPRKR